MYFCYCAQKRDEAYLQLPHVHQTEKLQYSTRKTESTGLVGRANFVGRHTEQGGKTPSGLSQVVRSEASSMDGREQLNSTHW